MTQVFEPTDGIVRTIHECPPKSQFWRVLTHIDTSTKERAETMLSRLRSSMPMSEFKLVEVHEDDIPF